MANRSSDISDGMCFYANIVHFENPWNFHIVRNGSPVIDYKEIVKHSAQWEPKNAPRCDDNIVLAVCGKGNWLRALVLHCQGDFVNVYFLDSGESESVYILNIKNLPEEHKHSPPWQAIRCKLDKCYPRDDKWSDEANKFMLKLIDGKSVWVRINRIHANSCADVEVQNHRMDSISEMLIYGGDAFMMRQAPVEPPFGF